MLGRKFIYSSYFVIMPFEPGSSQPGSCLLLKTVSLIFFFYKIITVQKTNKNKAILGQYLNNSRELCEENVYLSMIFVMHNTFQGTPNIKKNLEKITQNNLLN